VVWAIAALALAGVIVRPWRVNEAWWAAAGALALVLVRAISPHDALNALARGLDVYAFLIGMLALAEFAKLEGVFDWAASYAVRAAGRSSVRLFAIIYGVGILTTALLSNDATIVVLTPAVIVALQRTDAPALPYLFACAFVANAASFILPISNPSNLLVFGSAMPALGTWLRSLVLPSLIAIVVTALGLGLLFRSSLRGAHAIRDASPADRPATSTLVTLAVAALVLIAVSARNGPLGTAAFALAVVATIVLIVRRRDALPALVSGIQWPIVPLTAALFVIVTAVDAAGALGWTRALVERASPLAIGWALALASNVANNLPVGLNAGETVTALHPEAAKAFAALVGVNLGPNLTTNGSLATILWLAIVRKNGQHASPLSFLRTGIIVTPIALTLALLALR
jgi:arsenical pump membrane protein